MVGAAQSLLRVVFRNPPRWFPLLVLGIFINGCMTSSAIHKNPLDMGLEPASFVPRTPETWTLPNGVTVLHLRDDELPLVRGTIYVRGGSLWEDSDEAGVASATGALMRRGGAGSRTSDEVDLAIERLSASVSTSISSESGAFGFSCLKGDLNDVFSIFADVILRPRFEEDKTSLFVAQVLESIRRRKDDGDTIAGLSFSRIAYGDTPYGSVLTSKQVKDISSDTLRAWHNRWIRPDGAIFAVTGDISREEIQALYDKELAGWKPTGNGVPEAPPLGKDPKPAIYFIEAPFSQATVLIGQLGVERLSPDHFAIKVFNRIFGAGMGSSRLYERVRSELGLAYGVYGSISPGLRRGLNSVQLQTKAENAGLAIKESVEIIKGMQQSLVPLEELEERKRGVINSFVFANEDADSTVYRQALFRLYDFPLDYDSVYVSEVEKVDPAAVKKVGETRWDIGQLFVVVVGPKEARQSVVDTLPNLPMPMNNLSIVDATFDETVNLRD